METIMQDLRYGIRTLIRTPGFAVVSALTLALAIGVNTAIFSLVSVIVFADLPMQDAETVSVLRSVNARMGVDRGGISYPDYLDLRERATSFDELSAMADDRWILTGGDEPIRVSGSRISANLLDTWRRGTSLGRGFLPEEEGVGGPAVAILAHGFWQSHFGGSPDILGSSIRLDGEEFTIVGVMSPDMEFADFAEIQVWLPLRMDRNAISREQRALYVTGRLAPGVTQEQAQQEIEILAAQITEEQPEGMSGWSFRSIPMKEALVDDDGDTIIIMLSLTVAFVLLIACANVANMLLARSSARAREIAVRAAIGARRIRLVRQLLTESLVIAVVAAALGLGLAHGLLKALIAISAGQEVVFLMARLDSRVLLFTLAVAFVSPLAFGLLPALRASSTNVSEDLKEGSSRSGGGRRGGRTRSALVGAQISLALMLMIVAGLLVRTVINLQTRPLGYDPAGVLSMVIDLPESEYSDDQTLRQYFERVTTELASVPGVRGVGLTSYRPAVEFGPQRSFEIEGRPPLSGDEDRPSGTLATTTADFLELLDLPILHGRGFTAMDNESSLPVALVSQQLASSYWEDDDPVGQRMRIGFGDDAQWIQIVGVTGDIRATTDSELPDAVFYLPFTQAPRSRMVVLVRAEGDPGILSTPVRSAIWSVDPGVPVDDMRTLLRAQRDVQATGNALITLFAMFAFFALLMAGIGIYGVMSYAVSKRAGEISIRMALGAEAGEVSRMVMGQGARVVLVGTAVGLGGAYLLSRLLSNLVFGISTTDPITFIGVPAVLGLVALAANYLPARRATRISPMTALRTEQ